MTHFFMLLITTFLLTQMPSTAEAFLFSGKAQDCLSHFNSSKGSTSCRLQSDSAPHFEEPSDSGDAHYQDTESGDGYTGDSDSDSAHYEDTGDGSAHYEDTDEGSAWY